MFLFGILTCSKICHCSIFIGGVSGKDIGPLTFDILRKHFVSLYIQLEPLDVADEMFQEGLLSGVEHDDVAEESTRIKRLEMLLNILKEKKNGCSFLKYALKSLGYERLLRSLEEDSPLTVETCKFFYDDF